MAIVISFCGAQHRGCSRYFLIPEKVFQFELTLEQKKSPAHIHGIVYGVGLGTIYV